MTQVLEFTRTQTRRTLAEAVEVFMRDRQSTGRGIADDTEQTYRERLGVFQVWAAGRGLEYVDEVDADGVDGFFIYLRDERKNPMTGQPLGDNTIRDYFLSLRAFFNALHKRGAISTNPISHKAARDFPEPETKQFTPTDQDMRKVLAIFDSPDALYGETDFPDSKIAFLRARGRAIFALMIDCGLRSYEVRSLDAGGIDWDYGTITFTAKGRRKGRDKLRVDTMPFGATTRQALLAYRKERDRLKSNDRRFFLTCGGTGHDQDRHPAAVQYGGGRSETAGAHAPRDPQVRDHGCGEGPWPASRPAIRPPCVEQDHRTVRPAPGGGGSGRDRTDRPAGCAAMSPKMKRPKRMSFVKKVSSGQITKDWLPVPVAAKLLGVSRRQIYQLIKDKKLRVGAVMWREGDEVVYEIKWVTRQSLERYARTRFT
jgi:site-specific recombinase XerC